MLLAQLNTTLWVLCSKSPCQAAFPLGVLPRCFLRNSQVVLQFGERQRRVACVAELHHPWAAKPERGALPQGRACSVPSPVSQGSGPCHLLGPSAPSEALGFRA